MASRFKYPFILLLTFSWVLVACFVGFQYHREKQYKVERLDGQLQIYNQRVIDSLDNADAPCRVPTGPLSNIRLSIINQDGRLLFDNTLDSLPPENHLDRPEIAEAIATGHGYTLRRHSASTDETYFYSATKGNGVIVRSAVPYSLTLQEILDAGNLFFLVPVRHHNGNQSCRLLHVSAQCATRTRTAGENAHQEATHQQHKPRTENTGGIH